MSKTGKMPEALDIEEPITDQPGPEPDLDEPEPLPKPLKPSQFLLLNDEPEDDR